MGLGPLLHEREELVCGLWTPPERAPFVREGFVEEPERVPLASFDRQHLELSRAGGKFGGHGVAHLGDHQGFAHRAALCAQHVY